MVIGEKNQKREKWMKKYCYPESVVTGETLQKAVLDS